MKNAGTWMSLLVRPFYREQAGLFLLAFTLLFLIIGKVDGAEIGEYHRSLAQSLCASRSLRVIVFGAWFLYARHYYRYVARSIAGNAYSFLYVLRAWPALRRFALLAFCDAMLLFPVAAYALAVLVNAFRWGYTGAALELALALMFLLTIPPLLHCRVLLRGRAARTAPGTSRPGYNALLLGNAIREWPVLIGLLKLAGCGLLLAVAGNNELSADDLRVLFFLYTFTVLAHGIFIRRSTDFEKSRLSFYGTLPVPWWKRAAQYGLVYAVLTAPEASVFLLLAPERLPAATVIAFWCSGWGSHLLQQYVGILWPMKKRHWLWFMAALGGLCYGAALAFPLYVACLLPLLLCLYPAVRFNHLRSGRFAG